MNKLIVGICTIVEVGCLLSLGGIALKRNNECYKAQRGQINAEFKNIGLELECILKDAEIRNLKEELAKFKKEEEA